MRTQARFDIGTPHTSSNEQNVGEALSDGRSESGDVSESDRLARVFAFTLSTALVWLGHDCRGGCPGPLMHLPADTWFRITPAPGGDGPARTLVVVDFTGQSPRPVLLRTLIDEINQCTGIDHIQVRERDPADRVGS